MAFFSGNLLMDSTGVYGVDSDVTATNFNKTPVYSLKTTIQPLDQIYNPLNTPSIGVQFGTAIRIDGHNLTISAINGYGDSDYISSSDRGAVLLFNYNDSAETANFKFKLNQRNRPFGSQDTPNYGEQSVTLAGNKIVIGLEDITLNGNSKGILDITEFYKDSIYNQDIFVDSDSPTFASSNVYIGAHVASYGNRFYTGGDDDVSRINNGQFIVLNDKFKVVNKMYLQDSEDITNFIVNKMFAGPAGVVVTSEFNGQKNEAHYYDHNGSWICRLQTPSNYVSSGFWGYSGAVGHNRIVLGDYDGYLSGEGGSQDGRAFVYDLDGNLLKTIDMSQEISGGDNGTRFARNIAITDTNIFYTDVYSDNYKGRVYISDLNGNNFEEFKFDSSQIGSPLGGVYLENLAADGQYLAVGTEYNGQLSNPTSGDRIGAVFFFKGTDRREVSTLLD